MWKQAPLSVTLAEAEARFSEPRAAIPGQPPKNKSPNGLVVPKNHEIYQFRNNR